MDATAAAAAQKALAANLYWVRLYSQNSPLSIADA